MNRLDPSYDPHEAHEERMRTMNQLHFNIVLLIIAG